jgi:hypothetical protein
MDLIGRLQAEALHDALAENDSLCSSEHLHREHSATDGFTNPRMTPWTICDS